jgi:hypothetical protein
MGKRRESAEWIFQKIMYELKEALGSLPRALGV